MLNLNPAGPPPTAARAAATSSRAAGANRNANFADVLANFTAAPADPPDVGRRGLGSKTTLPAAVTVVTAAAISTTDDQTTAAVVVIDVSGLLTVPVLDPVNQRPGPDLGDGRFTAPSPAPDTPAPAGVAATPPADPSDVSTPTPHKAAAANDSRSLLSRELSGMTLVEPWSAVAPGQAAAPATGMATAPPPFGTLTFVRVPAASGADPAAAGSPSQTGAVVSIGQADESMPMFKPRSSPAGPPQGTATEITALSPSPPGELPVATASSLRAASAAAIATPLGKPVPVVASPPNAATSRPPPPLPAPLAQPPGRSLRDVLSPESGARQMVGAAAPTPIPSHSVTTLPLASPPQTGAPMPATVPSAAARQTVPVVAPTPTGSPAAIPSPMAASIPAPRTASSAAGVGVAVPAPAAPPVAVSTTSLAPGEAAMALASLPQGATVAVQSSPLPTGTAATVSSPDPEGAISASREEVGAIPGAQAIVSGQAAVSDLAAPHLPAAGAVPLSSPPADASVPVSSLPEAAASRRHSPQSAASLPESSPSPVATGVLDHLATAATRGGTSDAVAPPAAAAAAPGQAGAGVPVVAASPAGMLPDPAPTHAEPSMPIVAQAPGGAVDSVIATPQGSVDAPAPTASGARPGLGKVASSSAAAGPAYEMSGGAMLANSNGPSTTAPLADSGQSPHDEPRGGRAQPHAGPSTPSTVAHEMPAFHVAPVPPMPSAAAAPMAAAGAAASVSPVDGAELVPQIVQAVKLQWNGDIGEAHLRLRPDYLGELTISIHVDRGMVTATLASDMPAVREWLQRHESLLRQGLADQGLQLDRLVVAEDAAGKERETGDRPPPGHEAESEQPPSGEKQSPRRPRPDDQTFEVVA